MRNLRYELYGFENLTLSDNKEFSIENDLIKSIEINDTLDCMFVSLKDNVLYKNNMSKIENYLDHICFNMIINSEVSLNCPYRKLKELKDNDGKHTELIEHLYMADKMYKNISIGAESFYKNITQSKTAIDDYDILYKRIFRTLWNPDKTTQFLSLYQLLYELASSGEKNLAQRHVTNYIKKNTKKYPEIKINEKSSKTGKDEDSLTHLRNKITHCENTNNLSKYEELGKEINGKVIKQVIIIINDLIIEKNK